MKIYIEETGSAGGYYFDDKKPRVCFTIFVKPLPDGTGHWYSFDGKLCSYKWANPKRAKVFDSKELPKEFVYSIKHGLHNATVLFDKKDDWTIDDLEYKKVDPLRVKAYNKIMKSIDSVTTLDEYHKLYPLILKADVLDYKIMKKLFSLYNQKEIPTYNGEIGISFYLNTILWKTIIKDLGW